MEVDERTAEYRKHPAEMRGYFIGSDLLIPYVGQSLYVDMDDYWPTSITVYNPTEYATVICKAKVTRKE